MKPITTLVALLSATIAAHAGEENLPGIAAQPASYFYTGKPYDSDLDAYAFAFRSYDPVVTRWTSTDPSGFPDGPNYLRYSPVPTASVDPLGLRVQWVTNEASFSPNATMEAKPATTFTWLVSNPEGETILLGTFTGTFSEAYHNSASVGFVTWRDQPSTKFGDIFSLSLYSRTESDPNWRPNGWTVYGSFIENANYSNSDRNDVNSRINPW